MHNSKLVETNSKKKYEFKSLIIGSFRKHYQGILEVIDLFNYQDIEVLSPKKAIILNPEDEFVLFDYDAKGHSEKEIESAVLNKMHNVDFVYLFNPDGYVGLSAAFEIGYCTANNIRVYAMEPSSELCVKYIDGILKPIEIVGHLKNNHIV